MGHEFSLQVLVLEEACIAANSDSTGGATPSHADRASAICHSNGITNMTAVDLAERTLLSCGHDGTIKAWR